MSAEPKRVTKTEVWVGWENQVINGAYPLRRFLTYLDTAWDRVRLADVTQTMLDAYLLFCRQGKKGQVVTASAVQDNILIPIKLAWRLGRA